jgi:hypothetical protein
MITPGQRDKLLQYLAKDHTRHGKNNPHPACAQCDTYRTENRVKWATR